ncbi:Uncharacterized membrane protein YoaK, UPF0700 family [Cetobacterium ceti]|uniref:Uncharacterized membrane protein YoaK, UPF0700 family n=1 Tax=Cetobacterium ceti TaxID=180163 RepID=A0A1T4NJ53_9FUSO|nr:YoaK family protein [Cetobacterium ceti]SJZ79145.1 Uncharacterized membrane protein YoaK, UPF0700 family [Cetobacterium ceti]
MDRINRTLLCWVNSLTFLSGGINVAAIVAYSITVSHLTGNLSKVPIDIENGDFTSLYTLMGILTMFLTGSTVSGVLIGEKNFTFGKRYGWTLEVMAFILIGGQIIFDGGKNLIFVLSFLMGLQNGLFIMYKGAVTRTTHVTGSFTDLGIYLGHYLKGDKSVLWRIKYYIYNIFSFALGGGVGATGYSFFSENFFYFLGIGYIIAGAFYFRLRKKYQRLI